METLTTLKLIHITATVLLLLSGLGLAVLAWRKRSAGPAVTVQRPWAFVWLLMGICLISMPFTGWWLGAPARLAVGENLDPGFQHPLHRSGAGLVLAGGAA
ncbi:putative membrane protein [Pseudomonas synxantha]|nr:putative membrane protein [Pseudomonas synxantha]